MGGYVVGLCLGTVLAPICIRVIKTKMDADEHYQRPNNNNSDCPLDNQQPTRKEEPNNDYAVSNRNNISVPRPINYKEEGAIEYELTDYQLQNDIEETIHSFDSFHTINNSLSHSSSSNSIVDNTNNNRTSIQSRQSIDAPSSMDAPSSNIDDVHLFEIHDSWLSASNDSNDNGSHIMMDDGGGLLKLKEQVCNDDDDEARDDNNNNNEQQRPITVGDDNRGALNGNMMTQSTINTNESSAEIMKNLVVKCLVRNNCKGTTSRAIKGGVRVDKGGKLYERQDPPSLDDYETIRSKQQQQQQQKKQMHQVVSQVNNEHHDMTIHNNNNDNNGDISASASIISRCEQERQSMNMIHTNNNNNTSGGMNSSGASVVSRMSSTPPRPDVVRYYTHNNSNMSNMSVQESSSRPDIVRYTTPGSNMSIPESSSSIAPYKSRSSTNMLMSINESPSMMSRQQYYKRRLLERGSSSSIANYSNKLPQPYQYQMGGRQQHSSLPSRHDVLIHNTSAPTIHNQCQSSFSYSTNAQLLGTTPPSLPGVVELNPIMEEEEEERLSLRQQTTAVLLGQSDMRRQRYKELLKQQQKQMRHDGVASVASSPI